jgi:hypothetical protein
VSEEPKPYATICLRCARSARPAPTLRSSKTSLKLSALGWRGRDSRRPRAGSARYHLLYGSGHNPFPVGHRRGDRLGMKAKAPKKRTPRPSCKPDDPEQFKRFVETGRKLDVDESGKALDRAFDKIVPPKSS